MFGRERERIDCGRRLEKVFQVMENLLTEDGERKGRKE